MISADLKRAGGYRPDGRWVGPQGPIVVEVKKTSSVRDVRDAFLGLAYVLSKDEADSKAVCVIVDSRLSESRLQEELDQFRNVIHPSIAGRVHFLVDRGEGGRNATAFSGSMEHEPGAFYAWLGELVATERPALVSQMPARQLVIAALAQLRLWNRPPVTIKHLQESCRVSYPTVAFVLRDLADKGWLEASGVRGVRLRRLTTAEWMDLARDLAKQRKPHFFTDPTGQSSPEQLLKRLQRLQDAGKLPRSVRVGGVIGASWHFPELDITAPPRLDLSLEADPLGVASMLDAGLQLKARPEQRIVLAVHVTRDPWVITDSANEPEAKRAGELECLADLVEMGFTREATEMAHHMEQTNQQGGRTA
jgi:hypothetical protein